MDVSLYSSIDEATGVLTCLSEPTGDDEVPDDGERAMPDDWIRCESKKRKKAEPPASDRLLRSKQQK